MVKVGEYKDFWQFKYTHWTKRDRVEVFRLKNGELRVFEDFRQPQDFISGRFARLLAAMTDPKTGEIYGELHINKAENILTNPAQWILGKNKPKQMQILLTF